MPPTLALGKVKPQGMSPEGIFILRNQTKSLQIASFSPPSINAGCGGIDAYLGHFPLSIASKLRS
ncbi:hypothetical protein NVI2019_PEGOAJLN_03784 (plasmid) [Providencia alcalifaciens]|nr:hypothetical protein NVI2019_OGMBKCAO_03912 [Providencia alcalifaciens]CAG9435766.1 hypothetical protein NVI2019_PEGOAJLN_03784 [Providencia alcalifaciens]CAG9436182.1 hypothetical protein NVI2019_PLFLNFOB_04017 [Providencia alcalifaciens]CAG9436192.1 hypothetical protein NVI2019_ANGEOOBF_04018 [Providencia alcalifaciens]CAG9436214.1 hypothetical protein NVI2019_KOLGMIGM_04019 [Providencia alcalifaciens]